MAQRICGEISVDFHKNGNWQDLADILLMNGYTLEISMENREKILPFSGSEEAKIYISIMKELEER